MNMRCGVRTHEERVVIHQIFPTIYVCEHGHILLGTLVLHIEKISRNNVEVLCVEIKLLREFLDTKSVMPKLKILVR